MATLEEDDALQDVWARLLVNGGDANSGIELRRAFVSVLTEMTTLDVRNLAQIEVAAAAEYSPYGVSTGELPERAIPRHRASAHEPSWEVKVSLSNLDRLGCITSTPTDRGDYIEVDLTPFGRAFIHACTR